MIAPDQPAVCVGRGVLWRYVPFIPNALDRFASGQRQFICPHEPVWDGEQLRGCG